MLETVTVSWARERVEAWNRLAKYVEEAIEQYNIRETARLAEEEAARERLRRLEVLGAEREEQRRRLEEELSQLRDQTSKFHAALANVEAERDRLRFRLEAMDENFKERVALVESRAELDKQRALLEHAQRKKLSPSAETIFGVAIIGTGVVILWEIMRRIFFS
jgi:peptidoglycan hydrolase CwlO-like protein